MLDAIINIIVNPEALALFGLIVVAPAIVLGGIVHLCVRRTY